MTAAVFIALIGVNIYLMKQNHTLSKEELKTFTVREMALTDSFRTSGIAVPAKEQKAYVDPSIGNAKITVKEGQRVHKGMPLITYDSESAKAQIEQLENDQERLNIKIQEISQKLEEDRQSLNKAQSGYASDGQAAALTSQIASLQNEKRMAELDLKDNQSKLAEKKDKLEKLTVKSSINGTVAEINTNLTDTKPYISMVYVISDKLKVKGRISERDYAKAKKGTEVIIKPKSAADKSLTGTITDVSAAPEEKASDKNNNLSFYTVNIRLDKGSEKTLKYGFHVSIDIPAKITRGLVVPYQSVIRDGEHQYVILEKDNKRIQTEVETGLRSDNYQEILQGLSKGDQVILNPDHKVVSNAVNPQRNWLIKTFLKAVKADKADQNL